VPKRGPETGTPVDFEAPRRPPARSDRVSRDAMRLQTATLVALAAAGRDPTDLTHPTAGRRAGAGAETRLHPPDIPATIEQVGMDLP
jgi:hypothetical protein